MDSPESQPSVWRRLSPLVIVLAYSVIGLLWIVASDLFAARLGVGGIDIDLSVAKGIGFVLVTGALLYFVLLRRERWLTAARAELAEWVTEPPSDDLGHLRALLVDDDPDDRLLVRDALTRSTEVRFEIDEAITAADGRRRIAERAHDIYLIDFRLPDGSGVELIREFHSVASGPMMLITGNDDSAVDEEAFRSGAYDFLVKAEIEPSWIGRTIRYAVANWRSARELRRTRRRYSEIVAEAPVGLFRSTPEGGLTEGNPALLSIFGAETVEQIQQLGLRGLYRNPADRERLIRRVEAGESIDDEDIRMQRLDGTPIEVRMRMRGVRSDDGVIALHGALIDVTDELERARRVAMQASMLDQVKNAVVRTDMRGIVTYWNRAAEVTFGWPAEEVLGRPVVDITPAPEELTRAGEIMQSMAETGAWEGEFRCKRKDGSTFPAYVSNSVLRDPSGTPVGFVGVTVDLTELHAAEERVAAERAMTTSILESVRFPACILDQDATIIAVNGAWTQSAIDKGADLDKVGVGVNYLEVCDRADGKHARIVAEGIREVLGGEAAIFSHEYPCGTDWFRLEVARVAKPMGGAVAMHIDITQLRDAARQAEEFARSKDRLIASVSHELRTPLTAVLGFADLIEHPADLDAEEVQNFAAEIHRQATDMAGIVEDLLVAARAEMGSLAVQITEVDPMHEISGVVRNLSHRPAVHVENRAGPTPKVSADPLRLRQVLRNLINNAARYGGGRIAIETEQRDFEVAIRVLDNGPGIPEEHQETIFQPFFSAHDRTGQPDSLGLGLSVVRTLTEAMGGRVALHREDGWTVFEVTLQASGT